MTKIYISKSKQSDFNELLRLKSELDRYKDVEITEFQGGTYNDKLLREADIVIFLAPSDSKVGLDSTVRIGRGQFEEFTTTDDMDNEHTFLYKNGVFYYITGVISEAPRYQTYQNWGYLDIEDQFEIDLKKECNLELKESSGKTQKGISEVKKTSNLNDKKKLLILNNG